MGGSRGSIRSVHVNTATVPPKEAAIAAHRGPNLDPDTRRSARATEGGISEGASLGSPGSSRLDNATAALARMSNAAAMIETEDIVGKATLVGDVPNMLKDGGHSGPPTLFRHASMQRIRHCCQNLNLFPYLLYSFDNSKSHPIARKVHLCFDQLLQTTTSRILLLQTTTSRILLLQKSFRRSLIRGIHSEESQEQESAKLEKPCRSRFRAFGRQKRKENPLFLILAVYFAPLLLACQLIGLFSLMVFGKYTPGFIFLFAALLFLGCISLKIFFHESMTHMEKCEKKKEQ